MNRIEFVQSITTNIKDISYTDMIIKFFDQHMILYDIIDSVKTVEITDISTNPTLCSDIITFKLSFNDSSEANENFSKLNNDFYHNMYGKRFHIIPFEMDDTIIIRMEVVPL